MTVYFRVNATMMDPAFTRRDRSGSASRRSVASSERRFSDSIVSVGDEVSGASEHRFVDGSGSDIGTDEVSDNDFVRPGANRTTRMKRGSGSGDDDDGDVTADSILRSPQQTSMASERSGASASGPKYQTPSSHYFGNDTSMTVRRVGRRRS